MWQNSWYPAIFPKEEACREHKLREADNTKPQMAISVLLMAMNFVKFKAFNNSGLRRVQHIVVLVVRAEDTQRICNLGAHSNF
mmetsp:Transcript_154967/g.289097  ORF Transcript_154967/g.289097 Transcript_154967/m.289097 type:complete len:83 (+) Transcript_154967:219-467(+)